MRFNLFFLFAICLMLVMFPMLGALAQGVVDTTPTTADNSVCVEGACLTGVTALILTIASVLVFIATFIIKAPYFQDEMNANKFWFKLVHKIAKIEIKGKK